MEHKVTASGLGAYFHNQCALYLHRSTHDSAQRAAAHGAGAGGGAPIPVPAHQRAVFDKGNMWETRLEEQLAAQGCLLDGKDMDVAELLTSFDPTPFGGVVYIHHLRFAPHGDFLAQLNVGASAGTNIVFGYAHPFRTVSPFPPAHRHHPHTYFTGPWSPTS
jgi:hypothetical protein